MLQTMVCSCGGETAPHVLGVGSCKRERAWELPRKVTGEEDRWVVEGHTITGTTLREQRLYSEHPCGRWSKPKVDFKVNQ